MSVIDDATRLRHMLDAGCEALEMSKGKNRDDLANDRKLSLALVKLLETVGEAAYKVSQAKRLELDQIEFEKIIKMRHRLVHNYFDINYDVIWNTIQNSLPELVKQLKEIPECSNDMTPPFSTPTNKW